MEYEEFLTTSNVVTTLATLLFTRLLYVLGMIRRKRVTKKCPGKCELYNKQIKTMIVMGSGGHSAEMMKLVQNLPDNYTPRIYLVANNDQLSEQKIIDMESVARANAYTVCKVRRSRNVHQLWVTSLATTSLATLDAFKVYIWSRPELILCNGPGTCVPICLVAFLSRIFFLRAPKIIFVESICRVTSISLSGKILYYIADQFVVQWSSLQRQYPYSTYLGWIF